jgi:hypothetical protein
MIDWIFKMFRILFFCNEEKKAKISQDRKSSARKVRLRPDCLAR